MKDMVDRSHTVKISVVMPVFNAERYLSKAIASVLSQTYADFELLIIDDGSSDGSKAIIEHFAMVDLRVRAISRENRGISYSRNEGLAMANGAYIAWMDADDISLPGRLEAQLEYLEKHPDAVAVGCGVQLIDPDDDVLCEWNAPKSHAEIDAFHISGRGGGIIFPSSMMRKSSVISVGGFRDDIVAAEDLDLFLRLAEIGELENMVPVHFLYRQHRKSISHNARGRVVEDTRRVLSSALARRGMKATEINVVLGEQKIDDIYRKWAWWALSSGYVKTARKHALLAFLKSPFKLDTLKLLACVARGR